MIDSVDVIIPTYKPERNFLELMDRLAGQTVSIHRIIIINTEQKYFERLTYGTDFSGKYRNVTVRHISKREFDHGRTRNQAVGISDARIFVMMTQDAMPADEFMIEKLIEALKPENAAVAYGRQLADDKCSAAERYTRNFNYPDEKCMKTKEDIERLGIKTFFCSNVCAAYKREIFDALGGFINHTIFNEDMIFAAGAVRAGYGIAYQPEARVYHSHDYSNIEQFKRNFDLGVSQAEHPEVFDGIPSESEGIKLVKKTIAYLKDTKQKKQIPNAIIKSGFKYMGYLAGKNYRRLSAKMIVKFSANREYWEHDSMIRANRRIDASKGYGMSEEETAGRGEKL